MNLRKILRYFHIDIFNVNVSWRRINNGDRLRYLKDIEISWPDLKNMVFFYIMDGIDKLQGRNPDIFMLITLFEVCQEEGHNMDVLGEHWGFLIEDL